MNFLQTIDTQKEDNLKEKSLKEIMQIHKFQVSELIPSEIKFANVVSLYEIIEEIAEDEEVTNINEKYTAKMTDNQRSQL